MKAGFDLVYGEACRGGIGERGEIHAPMLERCQDLTFLGSLGEELRRLMLNGFAAALRATKSSGLVLGHVFDVLENLTAFRTTILVRRHGASPIDLRILRRGRCRGNPFGAEGRAPTLVRMTRPRQPDHGPDRLTSYFWSGETIRSRSVGELVLSGTVDIPAPPARLTADWEREISLRLRLEPGDVEPLPLARARMRWPDYKDCVHAVSEWTRSIGLPEALATSDVALMACRGARYHHDGEHYGGAAFCNLFLSEDRGLDVHFPGTGHRIPLTRGTVVIFDTGQPHGVIQRGSVGFDATDFAPDRDCTQVFLTWELPIEDAQVGRALDIAFDIDPSTSPQLEEEQVRLGGARASVCQASGRWRRADPTS